MLNTRPLKTPGVQSILSAWSVLECVCVHGWTGEGLYSLAALMLLEIRMLTHSYIWLHRSAPWHRNRINVNDVRYKPRSSRYPLHLPPYICFSVSVDLNLNNQLSSPLFQPAEVRSNKGDEERRKQRRRKWDEMKWFKSVFRRCSGTSS